MPMLASILHTYVCAHFQELYPIFNSLVQQRDSEACLPDSCLSSALSIVDWERKEETF